MRFSLTTFCILLFQQFIYSQQTDGVTVQKNYQIHILKTNEPIKIDGELTENVWSTTGSTSPFFKKYPDDKGSPKRKTEVKTTYDDKFLYIAFISYDSGKVFSQTLKRDFGHDGNDGVAIVIDPTNQRSNGFFFVVNVYNAQSEDQLPLSNDAPWSWDNKWYSATKLYPDKWIAEIAIPFKSIRYTADKLLWGINFVRIDTKTNEYSTWTPVPQNFPSHTLGYTGSLIWSEPPPRSGSNMVFIPYVTATGSEDKQRNIPLKGTANVGFDGKIALSSSLNLDITVNPDFSQVEVDRQVTNLSRFSIFYPEKRPFFLENSDLFARFGQDDIRPFYSRRIGLDKNNNRIPILFGARLTGNIDKHTRLGFMNIQTGNKDAYTAENYSAATIQRNVLKRSVVRAYFLNRESFMSADDKKKNPLDAYGRNAGTEFDYSNLKGSFVATGSFNHSYKPGITKNNNFIRGYAGYNGRNLNVNFDYVDMGTNYYTDMGFVQRIENYDALRDTVIRLGYREIFNSVSYSIFPQKTRFNMHSISVSNDIFLNRDNSFSERDTRFEYNLQFRNTGFLNLSAVNTSLDLLFPISFTGAVGLPSAKYHYTQGSIFYKSDFRKKISYKLSMTAGGFYNGTAKTFVVGTTFRQQPHVNISLNVEYDKLDFPKQYGSAELFLISPQFEFNFSTKLFWTTFLQYNTQRNNFNINSRFQYRFKPMSDIFLVYTDNYFTTPLFKNKNRALVFKMNYWLNL